MSERLRVSLIILAIIIAVAVSAFFVHQKYFADRFPGLKELAGEIINPGPLRSGDSNKKAATDLRDEEIIRWTNFYRNNESVASLTTNEKLTTAARDKANDMLTRQYFEHVAATGEDVSTFVGEQGYSYSVVGENLALGGFADEKELVDAWMNSEGHRANILNSKYTEIGVASVYGDFEGKPTWLSVQVFAKPTPNCPLPNESLKSKAEDYKKQYESGDSLVDQYNSIIAAGQSLVDQGNAKIAKGNEIAKAQGNEKAQPYWDEGKRLQGLGQDKINSAEELKEEIDTTRGLYDKIDQLISEYNLQVENYNACISQ